MRRILLVLAVMLVGSLGVVTAATAAGRSVPGVLSPAAPPPVAAPVVEYAPGAGAADVTPRATTAVTVRGGVFDQVTLTGADGTAVTGTFDGADRTRWSATEPLAFGTTYTWGGNARGPDGTLAPLQGSFATVTPAAKVRGTINIGDDRTVGIAAPVRIQFNDRVSDRAAAERALSVRTSVPVEGSWAWLPDEGGGSRVDYRPKEYWPPGTTVTVDADLLGVAYGDGRYGAADVTSTFRIGRAQIVKADARSFRLIVVRDGQQVANYPASYGLTSDPNRNTRSGVHVVSERFTDKRMVSERYGYDLVTKWAVRISNNGEFIHANPASRSAQGSSNVTHGCINLSTADAKAYYESALFGDPVEVTGTGVPLSARDGDVWDWTLDWEQWKALSAL